MKQEITYEEFLDIENKLEIKSGMIIDISDVPKSNKLIQLKVEFDAENDIRTVVTNIKPRLLSKYGEDW
jgi:tRNA-binding EMAP/Myf-like protein